MVARICKLGLAAAAGSLFAWTGCGDDAAADGGNGGAGPSAGGGGSDAGGGGGATEQLPHGLTEVRMRDGASLATWIYLPEAEGPFPVLLVRNPYAGLNDDVELEAYARFFQDRGIGLVWQAVRGTGGSEGDFVPYVSEVADAKDTIEWMAAQPWSNGRFAAGGGSYLGYTAWASAAADPRVLVVLSDDTAADEEMTRHRGVLDGYLLSWWSYVERARFANDTEQAALTNSLNVPAADEAVLGRDIPYWNDLLEAGLAVYPEGASLRTLAKDICTPALHVIEGSTGWRDPIETWLAIEQDGCPEERSHQWLIVAPEPHAAHFSAFGLEDTWVTADMTAMLSAFLLEAEPAPTWPRVRYRSESDGTTLSASAWPPEDTIPVTFYLGAPAPPGDAPLSTTAPGAGSWTVVSDPAKSDPCTAPTDLWFTSEPLARDLVVVGEPVLTIPVTTEAQDFDLFVTLYDYLAGAEEYAVIGTESVRARFRNGDEEALPAGAPFDLVLDLTGSAHRVPAGHQLTLSVSPSQCGFAENPHTAEPLDGQTSRQVASVDVTLGVDGARLTVPAAP